MRKTMSQAEEAEWVRKAKDGRLREELRAWVAEEPVIVAGIDPGADPPAAVVLDGKGPRFGYCTDFTRHHWRLDEVSGESHVGGTCVRCEKRVERGWPAADANDYSQDIGYGWSGGLSSHRMLFGAERMLS